MCLLHKGVPGPPNRSSTAITEKDSHTINPQTSVTSQTQWMKMRLDDFKEGTLFLYPQNYSIILLQASVKGITVICQSSRQYRIWGHQNSGVFLPIMLKHQWFLDVWNISLFSSQSKFCEGKVTEFWLRSITQQVTGHHWSHPVLSAQVQSTELE